jgi:OFA family oxalate/formate antiporter-like MFS transporter
MESRNRKGWLAVLGCCMAIFWSGTIAFGYPGVMRAYWQETYKVGPGAVGLVVSFMLVALAVCMFFTGKWHMKNGMRKCLLVGAVFTAAAMVILNAAKDMTLVYVWAFVVNVGCSFVYGTGLATVQQWFPQRRGFVSGLVNLVFGISAAIMSPVLSYMMREFGYISMNYILMVIIVATNIVAALLAEVPDRTDLSEEARAAHNKILAAVAEKAKAQGTQAGALTYGEAVKTKPFWLIWLTWVFMGAAGISMVTLSTSYTTFLGLTGGMIVLTTFNITNGLSRIIAGTLSDAIGGQRTGCFSFIVAAIGYFALPHMDGLTGIAIFAAFVGYGFGTLFAITPPLASGIFGLKFFGMIFGLIFTAYGFVAGLAGPALAGYVLQATQNNYGVVFNYLAVFCLLGAFLIMLVKPIKASAT